MRVFKDYAAYYDMLYKDKDYSSEAYFIHNLIQQNAPGARKILNIGCGTGSHDFALLQFGYEITGIDISNEMILHANKKMHEHNKSNIVFKVGDARSIRLEEKFDVVISLFHVMSYQVSNEDVNLVFETVKYHLNPNGIFLFDCWYGPGVLTDLPTVRHKILENNEFKIHRISKPLMYLNENKVEVNFTIIVHQKDNNTYYELDETHYMRYFFEPEIVSFAKQQKLSASNLEEFPNVLTPTNWYRIFLLRAI